MKRCRSSARLESQRAAKRARATEKDDDDADASKTLLYIVSGCVCYTGQGYSPCSCPQWIEVTAADYARRSTWTYDDIRHLQHASAHRDQGTIVQWQRMTLVTPAAKNSMVHKLLIKYEKFQAALLPWNQPRYAAAFYMNGDFYYWPCVEMGCVLEFMDTREGVARSFINAAIFMDYVDRKIWCYAQRPAQNRWAALGEKGGDLAGCVTWKRDEEEEDEK